MKSPSQPLQLPFTRDEKARNGFVSALRRYVLDDFARELKRKYLRDIEPRVRRRTGRVPRTVREVHAALRHDDTFRFYSTLRVTSQDMLYHAVRPAIERSAVSLDAAARELAGHFPDATLRLDADVPVPRSVSAVDIHLMPGSYHTEYAADDLTMGAVYENRLALSTFGLFGPNLDDIGQSMARFVRSRFPNYSPKRIVDLGCTVGHNTGAWKDNFPDAMVTGVDVAAPCLRYAVARARSQRRAVRFEQMNAEQLTCADSSVDLVFSSMFLHEVPRSGIARILREAWRVLRPGGLMLHMELPPTHALSPFDAFYLDWDGYYNNEPYYRQFRALVPRSLTTAAGFAARDFVEFVVPSLAGLGEARWQEAIARGCTLASDKTGRLTSGVQWYCFGAFKT